MNSVHIPFWTTDDVLPPIDATQPVSPYRASLTDCILRFATSPERIAILDGFLRYRAALHAAGLARGLQWLDGSFLEHVEENDGRPPNDLDVVTFYRLPPNRSQRDLASAWPQVFLDHLGVKTAYRVDGYVEHLGMEPERLTRQASYWYSVWSHRRSQLWKGFVEVDLAPMNDASATAIHGAPARRRRVAQASTVWI